MTDALEDILTRVEFDQDFCPHRYGDSADGGFCEAALGVTGEQKCWNTRPRCQDPDNFARWGLQALFNGIDWLESVGDVSALSFPYAVEFAISEMPAADYTVLDFVAPDGLHVFRAGSELRCRWGTGSVVTFAPDVSGKDRAHVLIQVDAEGVARFFVDGLETGVDAGSAPREFAAGSLRLGAKQDGSEVMPNDSALQEVRIWSGEVSAARRRRNLWKSVRNDEPDLVHYWPVGSVNAEGFTDQTGGVDMSGSLSVGVGHSVKRLILQFSLREQPLAPGHTPSISDVDTAPSKLSPGEGIGRRASGSVTFDDHPSGDFEVDPYRAERISGAALDSGVGYDPADHGTYWGKWRARNYESFHNRGLRVIQYIGERERMRNYVMESLEGPDQAHRFRIEFMDPLIQLDGETAQAPVPNTGVIEEAAGVGDQPNESFTLKPAGIGDEEYSASGIMAIGRECAEFTRSGDTVTLTTRGVLNTEADSHDEDDVAQEVLYLQGTADEIQRKLCVDYAGIDPAFIDDNQWQQEAADHIGLLFEAYIPEPTSVEKLTKEFTEQAGFDIYWNEIKQTIPFVALKEPQEQAKVIDDSYIIRGSVRPKDQQEKRVSQVWVNYGLIDPTQRLDDKNNYRNLHKGVNFDTQGVMKWQKPKIKKIFSRFLNQFNQPGAEQAEKKIISRFAIPPRSLTFEVPLWRDGEFIIGQLLRLKHPSLQGPAGGPERVDWQVQGIERTARNIRIECEEFRLTAALGEEKNLPINSDQFNFNLREAWESVWGEPQAGDIVVCTVNVFIGSEIDGEPAFTVGDWPDGVDITIIVREGMRISGHAGSGGYAAPNDTTIPGGDGGAGGAAVFTRYPIKIDLQGPLGNPAVIAGGAGGGGGSAWDSPPPFGPPFGSFGGGGGAGYVPGFAAEDEPGPSATNYQKSENGTIFSGGAGGSSDELSAGSGGDPGQDGAAGDDAAFTDSKGGAGGEAGPAIDGISYVSNIGGSGGTYYKGGSIN